MRRTARHGWGGLLIAGALIIPAYTSSNPQLAQAAPVAPFLTTVEIQNHALQTLLSAATIPTISPAASLPVLGDPKLTSSQTASTSTVRGSPASLVASGASLVSQEAFVTVEDGQTLWNIAQTYGVTVDAIVETNNLSRAELIHPGQTLMVPGSAVDVPRRVALFHRLSSAVSIAQAFLWPARGRVTSGFGLRRHPIFGTREMHTGIDIGAPIGTPVVAARAGTVVFAGWGEGYGMLVRLDHGEGLSTVYSHLSQISVQVGQVVYPGDVIGQVGSTGYSTGPHLLFEIRVHGQPLDPLKYL